MENSPNNGSNRANESRLKDAAGDLLNEGKKYANELYEDGVDKLTEAQQAAKDKFNDAQDVAKQYSDELIIHVQNHPLKSVLVAAGIGFVLSALIRK